MRIPNSILNIFQNRMLLLCLRKHNTKLTYKGVLNQNILSFLNCVLQLAFLNQRKLRYIYFYLFHFVKYICKIFEPPHFVKTPRGTTSSKHIFVPKHVLSLCLHRVAPNKVRSEVVDPPGIEPGPRQCE